MKISIKLLLLLLISPALRADLLNLSDVPLFVDGSKIALVQLVMERDNKLFFEAYPSYIDINGDGVLDNQYKPTEIDYGGYFNSNFCYQEVGGDHLEPVSQTDDKTCSGAWSGDYLNYTTMTRMDLLLYSLYGGKRVVDTETETRLRRAFIPWENHVWGNEYTSTAVDGYNISDYTPLAQPTFNKKHLIATVNKDLDDVPWLRVRLDSDERIWDWVDKSNTQGDGYSDLDVPIDVTVCMANLTEDNCQEYPDGMLKPVGLLHEYGENDAMYFSLITGSYENNMQGGVLRQNMQSFGDTEVDEDTGIFTRTPGIVTNLDAIQIPNDFTGRNQNIQSDCGWLYTRRMENGECRAWGNPVAEMMYEGMRYLAGEMLPTADFYTDGGMDEEIGLEPATWDDPYSSSQPYASCSNAYQLVISDPTPSFDGDQLPGSEFENFTGSSLGTMDVGALADQISTHEDAIPGLKFIGEVGSDNDGYPSAKMVNTLSNIRGLAPEAAHREGSFYSSSVAYYGHQNDIHDVADDDQTVSNFVLALGSQLPTIDVPVGDKTISFAPFGKTINFCNRTHTYIPNNVVVSFDIEELTDTTGEFRVSFENMEQGANNDSDAISRYSYSVSGDVVTMNVDSIEGSGCPVQHMGYVVSGSTQDGIYLVVRNIQTSESADSDYELDVPPGATPGNGWSDGVGLPLESTINFTVSSSPAAEVLPSPLWYAAKWGGFDDTNNDGIPQTAEWDANGDNIPDNYFEVVNPSQLTKTMQSVFNQISEDSGAATSVVASSGSLQLGNKIYRSTFTTGQWRGDVYSQTIDNDGVISGTADWSANDAIQKQIDNNSREILTFNPESELGVPFQWPSVATSPTDYEIPSAQLAYLDVSPITGDDDGLAEDRLNYIRGESYAGFRIRSAALGDIISSSPVLVGPPSYNYPDDWGTNAPESNAPYSEFKAKHMDRQRVVYVGANDGMMHALDAGHVSGDGYTDGTGSELFAYVPAPVYPNLPNLTNTKYSHKYFVDSTPRAIDAFINGEWRTVLVGGLGRGGQGIYALDITEPDKISEASAEDTVLWEFDDSDEHGIGYTYQKPLVVRMENGKWNVIIANGYNSSENGVGYRNGGGWPSILIIDLETGAFVKKLHTRECPGNSRTPNSFSEPTAIDIDGNGFVDTIYSGTLTGCVSRFDVSSSYTGSWNIWSASRLKHFAVDENGDEQPITTAISVGSHPTGEGVMLYFGTGKYLEPSDQTAASTPRRIYGIWDRSLDDDTERNTEIDAGNMLEQYIVNEEVRGFDLDGDGTDDTSYEIRETSQESIDWNVHEGWYMDLEYQTVEGEQIVASPILREGKILFTTHIPVGNECTPDQQGWLMALDAASGAMLDQSPVDLDGDGKIDAEEVAGVKNISNPFASPTVVSGTNTDFLLSQEDNGSSASSTGLSTSFNDGRRTWRELEP